MKDEIYISVADALDQAVADVATAWLHSPTDQPLVLERTAGGQVIASRGIQPQRMTASAAAIFLGMSRSTLYKQYISRGRLHVGTDGKIARRAVITLYNLLDGQD